jgi:hypothetical protein
VVKHLPTLGSTPTGRLTRFRVPAGCQRESDCENELPRWKTERDGTNPGVMTRAVAVEVGLGTRLLDQVVS